MNHIGHVVNKLLIFRNTHVHMSRDIDLKFREIKEKALRFVFIVQYLYNNCEELIYFIGLAGINMGLPAMMAEGERETSSKGPK